MGIVRTVVLVVIAILIALEYWSNNLIEERLIQIQRKVDAVQNKLESLHMVTPAAQSVAKEEAQEEVSNYPNILVPDPFMDVTLPKMLGPHYTPYPLEFLATISRPDNLNPFSNWGTVNQFYGYCTGAVGRLKTGFWEAYSPLYATRLEERIHPDGKGGAYWVFLRRNLYWQPLKQSLFPDYLHLSPHFLKSYPVTAQDFKFRFDVSMNPFNQEMGAVVDREAYKDVLKFVVVDDYTFYVEWKYKEFQQEGKEVFRHIYRATLLMTGLSPLPRFVYQYYPDGTKIIEDADEDSYRTNSSFAQQLTEHFAKNYIVSSGPYDFAGMDDTSIRFKRIPGYFNPNAALYGEIDVDFRNSQDSIWNDFKTDKMSTYQLPSYQLPEYERFLDSSFYAEQKKNGDEIERLDYVQRMFSYVGWNANRPIFASKKVRQALSFAIDVNTLITELYNDLAVRVVGPIANSSSNLNTELKPIQYDPLKAKKLLAEEGWKDISGNGVLQKEINENLVPFRFKLNYFVKSTIAKAICEVIAAQLKEVGIQCEPQGLEAADLSSKLDDKDFDSVIMNWVYAAPPEDLRQIWSSAGKSMKGSSNFISFSNARVDEIIALLEYENNPEVRKKLYWEFQDIIYDEQPYTFLYSPIAILLYRNRVHNVFIPKKRQDLIPGAEMEEPISSIFYEVKS